MNLNLNEITEMNTEMKSLENDIAKMVKFNEKLQEIATKKQKLVQFSEEKWMEYYEQAEKFSKNDLEILNQDSLYNAIVDTDFEAREMIKILAKMI